MIMIIIGTLLLGSIFTTLEILDKRSRKPKTSYLQNAEPRIINLPNDMEKEKKRRHIH